MDALGTEHVGAAGPRRWPAPSRGLRKAALTTTFTWPPAYIYQKNHVKGIHFQPCPGAGCVGGWSTWHQTPRKKACS
eukprot:scaffold30_cov416-Prasinococcus_capsulatus_cf.AAC.41